MLRDLLWPLRYTQVYGAEKEPPKDTEGAVIYLLDASKSLRSLATAFSWIN